MGKKCTFNELPIYRCLCSCLKNTTTYILNFSKDAKQIIGYDLEKTLIETITLTRLTYSEKDIDEKIKFLKEIQKNIEKIEVYFNICFELKFFSIKQISELSKNIAEIKIQSSGWYEYTENKKEK